MTDMDDTFNSVSVQLLTLLNVSATKRPVTNGKKRGRPGEAEAAQETERTDVKRRKLGGKRKVVFAEDGVQSSAAKKTEKAEKVEVDIDAMNDEDAESSATSSTDAFLEHFGTTSVPLTPAAVEAVQNGKWTAHDKKVGSLGGFKEYVPEGSEVRTGRNPAKMDDKLLAKVQGRLDTLVKETRLLSEDFFKLLGAYQDVFISNKDSNRQRAFREATAAHALNHVLRTRRVVMKNNERLSRLDESKLSDPPADLQDQGFTRPKLLILLPLRNTALSWVRTLIGNSPTTQTENDTRFAKEYSLPEGLADYLADNPDKFPADHVETFSGNIDDSFRFGLKLTRKAMKLYSEFYASDMIVASPLGLKILIEKEKSKSADFLSSIEILIIDQLDVMSMQNWEHLQFVLEHLNQLPSETRDSDFSRIKPWYLDGLASKLRQTIMFSTYETPEMRALFSKSLVNVAGKLKTEQRFAGLLSRIPKGTQQTFTRFNCASPIAEPDARFELFTKQILPSLLKSAVRSVNTIIFVPSYFDFVRLRTHLKDADVVSYAVLSEDSTTQEIARARHAFVTGRKALLIMTERFHFYRRYKIRGAKNIIFYAPPEHGNYYEELLSFPFLQGDVTDPGDVFSQTIFSQYDFMRLERIVGTSDARRMIRNNEDIFTFV